MTEQKRLMLFKDWCTGSRVRWKVYVWNWDETSEAFICERLPGKRPVLLIGVLREYLHEIKPKEED